MKQLVDALKIFLTLSVLTGLIYPALITVCAQLCFPHQANGSLIVEKEITRGSELLGQEFTQSKYFWSRVSSTSPFPYNASASSGSNLGPTNPKLKEGIAKREAQLKDQTNNKVPADLLTSSGSGLDPHISQASAEYQVDRVAKNRGLPSSLVASLVKKHSSPPQLGILGEQVVNVLALNLELDQSQKKP